MNPAISQFLDIVDSGRLVKAAGAGFMIVFDRDTFLSEEWRLWSNTPLLGKDTQYDCKAGFTFIPDYIENVNKEDN